ncbi:S8 family serine peptidase, partial [Candidatus Omnitrophota bacterium]
SYAYLAEQAAKVAETALSRAIQTFNVYPLVAAVKSEVFEIAELMEETLVKEASCREDFALGWTTDFILGADGAGFTASSYTTASGNVILTVTIDNPQNGHQMEFKLRDRELVSITDNTEPFTVEVNSRNAAFVVGSDGGSIWMVDMPDGSIVRVYDHYTAQATANLSAGVPEWSWKVTDFVMAFDFSELEGAYTESFRDFIMVKKIAEGVTAFFGEVLQAYQYALQEEVSIEEQGKVEYYRPFIEMLKTTNPIILAAGGIGQVASWIVSQGANITNCAMKSLLGYFEAQGGVTMDTKEQMATSAVISDILTGVVSPASVGEIETTMFTLKAIAGANGIQLHGVRTDLDALAGQTMPSIALIEESMQRHIVLVTAVTLTEVTYISDGAQKTESAEAFSEKFQGCVLSSDEADTLAGQTELTDEELMILAGSMANILEVKTRNLVEYLNSLKVYMDEIRGNIIRSVNSVHAAQYKAVAETINQEIADDAAYAKAESEAYPQNTSLANNAAAAESVKINAQLTFGEIQKTYNDIVSLERSAQDDMNTAEANMEFLNDTYDYCLAQSDKPQVDVSRFVSKINAAAKAIGGYAEKYPSNLLLKGLDIQAQVMKQQAANVKDLIAVMRKQVSFSSPEQVGLSDTNADGVVDQKDIDDFDEALGRLDLDGGGVTAEEIDTWEKMLNYLQYSSYITQQDVTAADVDASGATDETDIARLRDLISYRVDVNADGTVGAGDVTRIQDYLTQQAALDRWDSSRGAETYRKEYFYRADGEYTTSEGEDPSQIDESGITLLLSQIDDVIDLITGLKEGLSAEEDATLVTDLENLVATLTSVKGNADTIKTEFDDKYLSGKVAAVEELADDIVSGFDEFADVSGEEARALATALEGIPTVKEVLELDTPADVVEYLSVFQTEAGEVNTQLETAVSSFFDKYRFDELTRTPQSDMAYEGIEKILIAAGTLLGDGSTTTDSSGNPLLTGRLGRLMQASVEGENSSVASILDGLNGIVEGIILQENKMKAAVDVIGGYTTQADAKWDTVYSESMDSSNSPNLVKMQKAVMDLGSLARDAQEALNTALAVAMSNPNNTYFANMVSPSVSQVADLENTAEMASSIFTFWNFGKELEVHYDALDVDKKLTEEAVDQVVEGSGSGSTIIPALDGLDEARRSVFTVAQKMNTAAQDAALVADAIGENEITGNVDFLITRLKQRAVYHLQQASITATVEAVYSFDPENAEASEELAMQNLEGAAQAAIAAGVALKAAGGSGMGTPTTKSGIYTAVGEEIAQRQTAFTALASAELTENYIATLEAQKAAAANFVYVTGEPMAAIEALYQAAYNAYRSAEHAGEIGTKTVGKYSDLSTTSRAVRGTDYYKANKDDAWGAMDSGDWVPSHEYSPYVHALAQDVSETGVQEYQKVYVEKMKQVAAQFGDIALRAVIESEEMSQIVQGMQNNVKEYQKAINKVTAQYAELAETAQKEWNDWQEKKIEVEKMIGASIAVPNMPSDVDSELVTAYAAAIDAAESFNRLQKGIIPLRENVIQIRTDNTDREIRAGIASANESSLMQLTDEYSLTETKVQDAFNFLGTERGAFTEALFKMIDINTEDRMEKKQASALPANTLKHGIWLVNEDAKLPSTLIPPDLTPEGVPVPGTGYPGDSVDHTDHTLCYPRQLFWEAMEQEQIVNSYYQDAYIASEIAGDAYDNKEAKKVEKILAEAAAARQPTSKALQEIKNTALQAYNAAATAYTTANAAFDAIMTRLESAQEKHADLAGKAFTSAEYQKTIKGKAEVKEEYALWKAWNPDYGYIFGTYADGSSILTRNGEMQDLIRLDSWKKTLVARNKEENERLQKQASEGYISMMSCLTGEVAEVAKEKRDLTQVYKDTRKKQLELTFKLKLVDYETSGPGSILLEEEPPAELSEEVELFFQNIDQLRAASLGEDVKVAILDSGIDTGMLGVDILGGYDFTGTESGGDYTDLLGHGTKTASVVKGEDGAGIAPEADILALKVIDAEGNTTSSIVAEAIYYAIDSGARVIAMPLFLFPVSQPLKDAIHYAVDKGALLVAAAGNEGSQIRGTSIAGQDEVISVGSIDADGEISSWSNYGSALDVVAPWDVVTLEETSRKEAGTSFSAALIAGVAALMLSGNPGMTPEDILTGLKALTAGFGGESTYQEDDSLSAPLADSGTASITIPETNQQLILELDSRQAAIQAEIDNAGSLAAGLEEDVTVLESGKTYLEDAIDEQFTDYSLYQNLFSSAQEAGHLPAYETGAGDNTDCDILSDLQATLNLIGSSSTSGTNLANIVSVMMQKQREVTEVAEEILDLIYDKIIDPDAEVSSSRLSGLVNDINTAYTTFTNRKAEIDSYQQQANANWVAVEGVSLFDTEGNPVAGVLPRQTEERILMKAMTDVQDAVKRRTDETQAVVSEAKAHVEDDMLVKLQELEDILLGIANNPDMDDTDKYGYAVRAAEIVDALYDDSDYAGELYVLAWESLYSAADIVADGVGLGGDAYALAKEAESQANSVPVDISVMGTADDLGGGMLKAWASTKALWDEVAIKKIETYSAEIVLNEGAGQMERLQKRIEIELDRIANMENKKSQLYQEWRILDKEIESLGDQYAAATKECDAAAMDLAADPENSTLKNLLLKRQLVRDDFAYQIDQKSAHRDTLETMIDELIAVIGGHKDSVKYSRSASTDTSQEYLGEWTGKYKTSSGQWKYYYEASDNQYRLKTDEMPPETSFEGLWLDYFQTLEKEKNAQIDLSGHEIGPTGPIGTQEASLVEPNVQEVAFTEKTPEGQRDYYVTLIDNSITGIYTSLDSAPVDLLSPNTQTYLVQENGYNRIRIKDWDENAQDWVWRDGKIISHAVEFSYDGQRIEALLEASGYEEIGDSVSQDYMSLLEGDSDTDAGSADVVSDVSYADYSIEKSYYGISQILDDVKGDLDSYTEQTAEATVERERAEELLAIQDEDDLRRIAASGQNVVDTVEEFIRQKEEYESLINAMSEKADSLDEFSYNAQIMLSVEGLAELAEEAYDNASLMGGEVTLDGNIGFILDKVKVERIARQNYDENREQYEAAYEALEDYNSVRRQEYRELDSDVVVKQQEVDRYDREIERIKRRLTTYIGALDAAYVDDLTEEAAITNIMNSVSAENISGGLYAHLIDECEKAQEEKTAALAVTESKRDKLWLLQEYLNLNDSVNQALILEAGKEYEDSLEELKLAERNAEEMETEKAKVRAEIDSLLSDAEHTRVNLEEAKIKLAGAEFAAGTIKKLTEAGLEEKNDLVNAEALAGIEMENARGEWASALGDMISSKPVPGGAEVPVAEAVNIYIDQLLASEILSSKNEMMDAILAAVAELAQTINTYRVPADGTYSTTYCMDRVLEENLVSRAEDLYHDLVDVESLVSPLLVASPDDPDLVALNGKIVQAQTILQTELETVWEALTGYGIIPGVPVLKLDQARLPDLLKPSAPEQTEAQAWAKNYISARASALALGCFDATDMTDMTRTTIADVVAAKGSGVMEALVGLAGFYTTTEHSLSAQKLSEAMNELKDMQLVVQTLRNMAIAVVNVPIDSSQISTLKKEAQIKYAAIYSTAPGDELGQIITGYADLELRKVDAAIDFIEAALPHAYITRTMDEDVRADVISQVSNWLAANRPDIAVDIISWLDSQSAHFGMSAFDALKFFMEPFYAFTDFLAQLGSMAANLIIKDIESGVIAETAEGDLKISLGAMRDLVYDPNWSDHDAFAYRIDFDELKRLVSVGQRVIVNVGGDHYVVVTDINEEDIVTLLENNRQVTVFKNTFMEAWTEGVAMTIAQPLAGTALTAEELKGITGAGSTGDSATFGENISGALAKTRTYTRGMLTGETIYDGPKGMEYQIADVSYYEGSSAVRSTTISEVDAYGVQQEMTKYYRDTFVPESVTEYEKTDVIKHQRRGAEVPTMVTTYYKDKTIESGEAAGAAMDGEIESESVFTYGGAAGGLVKIERTVYDRIPGDVVQEVRTESDYTPEDPGRGRIEGSTTWVDINKDGTWADEEKMSTETYTYELPEGIYTTFQGLFAKESLSARETVSYYLDTSTSSGTINYRGLRGYEKPYEMTGTMPGVTSEYNTIYEHDAVMRSLAMTSTYNLPEEGRRVTWYTGVEGQEKVVVVKEYRKSKKPEEEGEKEEDQAPGEELASVSRFYYSMDGRLLRKVGDYYTAYGTYLYDKKPMTRKIFIYEGEPDHERVVQEIDDRGVVHYYKYFVDAERGLITAVVTNPEMFSALDQIDSQVLSKDLVHKVLQDKSYIQADEGTALFTDRDGNTIMSVDRYGGVSRYDYKKGSGGIIERDPESGTPVETNIYQSDGSYVTRNAQGRTIKEMRKNVKGELIEVTHTYSTEAMTPDGFPVDETREWEDYQWIPVTGDAAGESGWKKFTHTQVFTNGELFSQKTIGDGDDTSHFKWEKNVEGVWNFRYADEPQKLEDSDTFTLKVNPFTGAIETAYKETDIVPSAFGNYDFFCKDLGGGERIVYVYKGGDISSRTYTGVTLKYDGNSLTEFNDRVAEMVTLSEDRGIQFENDYGQNLYFSFARAPVSLTEMMYYEMREQMDFELEGGTIGGSGGLLDSGGTKRSSLEEWIVDIEKDLIKLEDDVYDLRLSRDTTVDGEIRGVGDKLIEYLGMSNSGRNKKITYNWSFNTVSPSTGVQFDPNSTVQNVQVAAQMQLLNNSTAGITGMFGPTLVGLMAGMAVAGIKQSIGAQGNPYVSPLAGAATMWPTATAFTKKQGLLISSTDIDGFNPWTPEATRVKEDGSYEAYLWSSVLDEYTWKSWTPPTTSAKVDLGEFKAYVQLVLDYVTGSFVEEVDLYKKYTSLYTAGAPPTFTEWILKRSEEEAGSTPLYGTSTFLLKDAYAGMDIFYAGDSTVTNKLKEIKKKIDEAAEKITGAYSTYKTGMETKVENVLYKNVNDAYGTFKDKYVLDTLTQGAEEMPFIDKAVYLYKYMIDKKIAMAVQLYQTRVQNEGMMRAAVRGNKPSGSSQNFSGDESEAPTPVWVPGSDMTPEGASSSSSSEEDDEFTEQLKKWMKTNEYVEYSASPGLMHRYAYSVQRALWQFKKNRKDLAEEIRGKEIWLDDMFDAEGNITSSAFTSAANSEDVNLDTYLKDTMKAFWDKGQTNTEGLSDTERTDIENSEKVMGELIEEFESIVNCGDVFYKSGELEHIRDYQALADLYSMGSLGINPQAYRRQWEKEDFAGYIDETKAPDFYSDYANQKTNLAGYAMFRYAELAVQFAETLERTRVQFDVPNVVGNLISQIRQYQVPGISSAEVLSELYAFEDETGKAKDPVYSLPDTIMKAADLKENLATTEAKIDFERVQRHLGGALNTMYSQAAGAKQQLAQSIGAGSDSGEGGRLTEQYYFEGNYLDAEEVTETLLDHKEEASYREFASEVGMGGKILADMYGAVEYKAAEELKKAAEKFKAKKMTEAQFFQEADKIRRNRLVSRKIMENYLFGTIDKVDLTKFAAADKLIGLDLNRAYGILEEAVYQQMTLAEKL